MRVALRPSRSSAPDIVDVDGDDDAAAAFFLPTSESGFAEEGNAVPLASYLDDSDVRWW